VWQGAHMRVLDCLPRVDCDSQDEANADDSDAGNQGVDADQQLLAHVTLCKLLPSSDI